MARGCCRDAVLALCARARARPPGSVVFIDWLSMTPAMGLASRPSMWQQRWAMEKIAFTTRRKGVARLAAGPIYTYPQAFESEHGRHRQMRLEIHHPVEGRVPNIGFPVKLSDTPQQVRLHPPLLGEHTEAVLAEIGIDAAAMEELRARSAFEP